VGLAHLRFFPFGLADHERAASQVFRFEQFLVGQNNLLKKVV
jgi:hypothetical protein